MYSGITAPETSFYQYINAKGTQKKQNSSKERVFKLLLAFS